MAIDMKEIKDVNLLGIENKKLEAQLTIEEKTVTLHDWDDT